MRVLSSPAMTRKAKKRAGLASAWIAALGLSRIWVGAAMGSTGVRFIVRHRAGFWLGPVRRRISLPASQAGWFPWMQGVEVAEPFGTPWDNALVIWLGERRGYLSDWVTQQWVRSTGRKVRLAECAWLDGPVGGTRAWQGFLLGYADKHNLELVESGRRGLLQDSRALPAAE